MTASPWLFTETLTSIEHTLATNPTDDDLPGRVRRIAEEALDEQGRAIVVTDGDEPATRTLKGRVDTPEDYDTVEAIYAAGDVLVTDHEALTMRVVFTGLDWARARNATAPWQHTYTLTANVVEVIPDA